MKNIFYTLLISVLVFNCKTSKTTSNKEDEKLANIKQNDTVTIANDDLEYEIIIIEPGFNYWLMSTARPEGYYSQQFLEMRNYQYVVAWNQRVLQPLKFDPTLYELQIDYQTGIDYGYDVNYKLYNYFIYFQLTYNERLTQLLPRI
ncbi:MAG: DUF6146 family protein [Flaviramulus sp.]|nr:DUF6146 family protein [Flaviramulus sp.]